MSKGKRIALWIVSILLAALFLFAGLPKLLMPQKIGPMFVAFGFPLWFMTFIGTCETLGAIGLLIPRLAGLAAAGLSIIMIGAFFTMVTHHQVAQAIGPVIIFILLVWVSRTRFGARGAAASGAVGG